MAVDGDVRGSYLLAGPQAVWWLLLAAALRLPAERTNSIVPTVA
jgi:hypothetical protein